MLIQSVYSFNSVDIETGMMKCIIIKKRSERCKHCALSVVRRSQKISPRRRPPSRGRGTAKI